MRISERLDKLPPYLFVEINRKIAAKRAEDVDIISFAIGDPDMPTPEHIIDKICQEARNPVNRLAVQYRNGRPNYLLGPGRAGVS